MVNSSVSESCSDSDCVCGCNSQPIDDYAFWEEIVSQLIKLVCTIERMKLGRTMTTSVLRKAGKDSLCNYKET